MPSCSKRGSILIGVLWSLFFLAALALVINITITPQLGLAARLRDRVMLRYFAKAGIQRAIIEIRADETQGYDALNEPWSYNEEVFKEISLTDAGYCSLEYSDFAGGDAKHYGLIDEERKININSAPVGILKQFFEIVAGVSSQDAGDIADAIVDWRDGDDEPRENGAENSYYEALEKGYPCKNASFEVAEELKLVKGITTAIFDKVIDRITVYGQGLVNINTADALVLEGLGISSELVERIIVFRTGGDRQEGTEDDNIFESAGSVMDAFSSSGGLSSEESEELETVIGSGIIGVRSDNFRGHSTGRFRDLDMSSKIVFVISRDEKIRYWREN
jgi:general secretion pathway protein K